MVRSSHAAVLPSKQRCRMPDVSAVYRIVVVGWKTLAPEETSGTFAPILRGVPMSTRCARSQQPIALRRLTGRLTNPRPRSVARMSRPKEKPRSPCASVGAFALRVVRIAVLRAARPGVERARTRSPAALPWGSIPTFIYPLFLHLRSPTLLSSCVAHRLGSSTWRRRSFLDLGSGAATAPAGASVARIRGPIWDRIP